MTYRDEFDEPPRGNGSGFLGRVGPKAAFFIILITLSFMIGLVWKLYSSSSDTVGTQVPIVRADAESFKASPDDPGGMDIPHKDSTIFSSLTGRDDESDQKVENLLADDDNESPMPRSQLFAGLNTDKNVNLPAVAQDTPLDKPLNEPVNNAVQQSTQNSEKAEEIVENMIENTANSVMPPPPAAIREGEVTSPEVKEVMKLDEPTQQPSEEVNLAPTPKKVELVKTEPVVEAPKVDVPKVKPKPAPIAVKNEAPKAVLSAGDYYVQLGSVKSRDGAESEWKKLQKKYGSVLSGYSHRVEVANLGEKGTFYRIQAGPVSKTAANSTCNEIKKIQTGGCLVKKK